MAPKDKARRTRGADVVTRDYTINLHKRLHGVCFKNCLQCSLGIRWDHPLFSIIFS